MFVNLNLIGNLNSLTTNKHDKEHLFATVMNSVNNGEFTNLKRLLKKSSYFQL